MIVSSYFDRHLVGWRNIEQVRPRCLESEILAEILLNVFFVLCAKLRNGH